nr:putative ribonuclease H-like domain-containing protein [Tanacetum cinerariifolium]
MIKHVSKLPPDDLEEMDLKWQMAMLTVRARRFLQRTGRNVKANGPTSMGFDMSKVECYHCHRKGHFVRECRSPKDARRNGAAEPQRRNVPVETSTSNALVSQCDCVGSYDWSFPIKEEPINYALMAFTSLSSSNSDNESDESLPPSLIYDRYQSGDRYHVVPPPYTETFMPPKLDLVFYNTPNVNESVHTAFNVELIPAKPDTDLSHTHRPSAPIIEDWVTDSEDDFEAEILQNAPSFVQPIEQVKPHRPSVKTIETSILTANHKITILKPKSNGNRRNRKACIVSVLTKSKLVPITAARPVTAAVPKPHVTSPRHAKSIVTKPHLPPRRHINHSPSPKASNFPPKVTVVKVPQDKGVIDSGCSRHMTGNISYLSDFEELNGRYFTFGGNPKGGKISGKGSGPTWLFDTDTLTKTVNYQPLTAGDQSTSSAGVQEQFDVEKVGEESAQQYVLFPIWSFGFTNPQNTNDDATFGEKKPEFEGRKPEFEVYVSPSRKFEDFFDNIINEVNATDSLVPAVGFKGLITQIVIIMVQKPKLYTKVKSDFGQPSSGSPFRPPFSNRNELVDHPIGGATSIQDAKGLVLVDLPHGKRAIVVRIEAIRLFFAYASFMGFMVYQMDVKGAFLYGTIEEEVYVCQPLGFKDHDHPDKVCKVVKALYGLHQAPRAWYKTLANYLLANDLCKAFEKLIKNKFQMSSMGELTFFLGLQVKQKQDGIFINRDKYIVEILRKFSLTDGKSASTPVDTEKPLLKDPDGEDVDVHTYRSIIGSLMYFISSRPDIMFANAMDLESIIGLLVNDVTRLQALVDKKKVIITEATIRDALRLNDVESIDCLPNEEIFTELSRMGYEKPSAKLTFYKAFFSPQWNAAEVNVDDVPAAGVADEGANVNTNVVLTAVYEPNHHIHQLLHHHHHHSMYLLPPKYNLLHHHPKLINHHHLHNNHNLHRMQKSQWIFSTICWRHGRIIDDMDADVDVTLKDVADIVKEVATDAEIEESADDDEVEPAELQEVVEVVTTAKLITKVVTAVSATITVAAPTLTTVVAPTLTTAPSAARRRKFKMDFFKGMKYDDIRPIFEKYFNSNVAFLEKTKEQIEEEDSRALKRISESQKDKAAKKKKLDEEVPVVDYAIHTENNKPYFKIIKADGTYQLFLSFLSLLRNFNREDLEVLWELVKERFASSKPKNFSDDFLLTTPTYIFEKPNIEDQVWKSQRGIYGLAKVKS